MVLGVRRDGQKILLAVTNMGGETEAAWRHVLDDLLARGLKAPELLIVDGGKVLTRVDSLGPDVREGKGLRDPKGYKMIEVMHPTTVDIVSPGNGQVALTFGAEPIVRAGTETE